jgi:hypothetical protein
LENLNDVLIQEEGTKTDTLIEVAVHGNQRVDTLQHFSLERQDRKEQGRAGQDRM